MMMQATTQDCQREHLATSILAFLRILEVACVNFANRSALINEVESDVQKDPR